MVVQKSLDSLKERPKDEKTAIAGGIAVTVVAILLIGWGFWVVKKIQRGGEFDTFIGGAQDEFNPAGVREAQESLQEQFKQNAEQLRDLRNSSNMGQPPPQDPSAFDQPGEEYSVPEEQIF